MTQEKELLFKDLCARLPSHVKVKIWLKDGTTEEGALDLEHNYANVLLDAFYYNKIKDIKPYLRPMSSMTKEEEEKYHNLCYKKEREGFEFGKWAAKTNYHNTIDSIDYLNSIHIDYRGLIPMGLAIEVTKENNPYKIKLS